jgi:hypothetical protein
MTKSPYTMIRELQKVYFEKHGSYAHACGYLGAVLEGEMARRPKKEQDAFVARLQEAIDWLREVEKVGVLKDSLGYPVVDSEGNPIKLRV